jgi:flagellar protein FlaG
MEIFNTVTSVTNSQPSVTNNQHQTLQDESVNSANKSTINNELEKTKKTDLQNTNEVDEEKEREKEIKKKLEEITEQLNKEMDTLNTTIRFGFNDKVDEMYVSVIDTKDNRVIRQIPSEEAMKLAAKMRELVGMLFDEKG